MTNLFRLLYHQSSDAVAHSSFVFHLLAMTDGVLVIDDELLALADTFVVALPDIALQPDDIDVIRWQGSA